MDLGVWISSAAIATVVSVVVTTFWERRKLTRSERADAYADFLSTFSKRWRSFADRDGAKKRNDTDAVAEAETRVVALREDLYDAYAKIQILGSQDVVEKALACVRLLDKRNRAYKNPGSPGVGTDERATALADFIRVGRIDLSLKALDTERLKQGFTSMSGALLFEDD